MASETFDVNMLNPFIKCTKDVFEKMARIQVQREGLKLKSDYLMDGRYSGIIGLAGAGSGSAIISLPDSLARTTVANMLYMEPEELSDDDIEDGVGELINMVAGAAKSSFSDTPFSFDISLPMVLKGVPGKYEVAHKAGVPCFEIKFSCFELGETFILEISIKSNN